MSATLGLPCIGQHHGEHIVVFVESVLVIELTGNVVGITVGRIVDILNTTFFILAILRDT